MTKTHAEIYVELMADLMKAILHQGESMTGKDYAYRCGEVDDIKKKLVCIVRGLG